MQNKTICKELIITDLKSGPDDRVLTIYSKDGKPIFEHSAKSVIENFQSKLMAENLSPETWVVLNQFFNKEFEAIKNLNSHSGLLETLLNNDI